MGLTLRSVKGSALTSNELDNNFRHFAGSHAVTGSIITSGSLNVIGNATITGSLTVSGSGTLTNIGPAVFSGSVSIDFTTVPTSSVGLTPGQLYRTGSAFDEIRIKL